MTIEISRGANRYQFRQREQEPNVIEWRANEAGARWQYLYRYATADEARAALLANRDAEKGEGDA